MVDNIPPPGGSLNIRPSGTRQPKPSQQGEEHVTPPVPAAEFTPSAEYRRIQKLNAELTAGSVSVADAVEELQTNPLLQSYLAMISEDYKKQIEQALHTTK